MRKMMVKMPPHEGPPPMRGILTAYRSQQDPFYTNTVFIDAKFVSLSIQKVMERGRSRLPISVANIIFIC